jgi:hypothetical protein
MGEGLIYSTARRIRILPPLRVPPRLQGDFELAGGSRSTFCLQNTLSKILLDNKTKLDSSKTFLAQVLRRGTSFALLQF